MPGLLAFDLVNEPIVIRMRAGWADVNIVLARGYARSRKAWSSYSSDILGSDLRCSNAVR